MLIFSQFTGREKASPSYLTGRKEKAFLSRQPYLRRPRLPHRRRPHLPRLSRRRGPRPPYRQGKMLLLDRLLKHLFIEDHKVLIFSHRETTSVPLRGAVLNFSLSPIFQTFLITPTTVRTITTSATASAPSKGATPFFPVFLTFPQTGRKKIRKKSLTQTRRL